MSVRAKGFAYGMTWVVFAVLLLGFVFFVTATAPQLPPWVASHFDAGGNANAFMSKQGYVRFVLVLGLGLPVGLVALLSAVYRRAPDLKLPNRDYWLAPERIAGTRRYLTAHGVWFGSLLVLLVGFVHRLELQANAQAPPHLSSRTMALSIILFLMAAGAWLGALLIAFRRPRAD
jgi:uncharacterized membrane protein